MSAARAIYIDGDTPRVPLHGLDTSHEAADSNNVNDSEAVVMVILRENGELADHELVRIYKDEYATKTVDYTPQRLRSARAHLASEEVGLVELVDGLYRSTDTGRRARVWRLVNPPEAWELEPRPLFDFDTVQERNEAGDI